MDFWDKLRITGLYFAAFVIAVCLTIAFVGSTWLTEGRKAAWREFKSCIGSSKEFIGEVRDIRAAGE